MSGIAQKLAANQKQVAISEFFEKNKHFLGFDSLSRSLITAVKEAVENGNIDESRYNTYLQLMTEDENDIHRKNDFA